MQVLHIKGGNRGPARRRFELHAAALGHQVTCNHFAPLFLSNKVTFGNNSNISCSEGFCFLLPPVNSHMHDIHILSQEAKDEISALILNY